VSKHIKLGKVYETGVLGEKWPWRHSTVNPH
jgi:hypothetical protein